MSSDLVLTNPTPNEAEGLTKTLAVSSSSKLHRVLLDHMIKNSEQKKTEEQK